MKKNVEHLCAMRKAERVNTKKKQFFLQKPATVMYKELSILGLGGSYYAATKLRNISKTKSPEEDALSFELGSGKKESIIQLDIRHKIYT